ncbi:DUF1802 family protein [Paenibacillus turpanensis]|uniref:DUF1802 family protein n=1 Tax=Paenibacillus turpanensis TaxID=2689078 RepID=UPI001408BA58|nr:DUF1802 family protein [Paenibacillus turpanensis]
MNPSVALKEWASAIKALEMGDQILLLRKGGISEETKHFQMESSTFYLFPTFEHQRKDLMKEAYRHYVEESIAVWKPGSDLVPITSFAIAEQELLIHDMEELLKVQPYHIWTEQFAEERLKWKKTQPLHLIILRVYKLNREITIPMVDSYTGCRSWITLEDEIASDRAIPVLDDSTFLQRKEELLRTLGKIE